MGDACLAVRSAIGRLTLGAGLVWLALAGGCWTPKQPVEPRSPERPAIEGAALRQQLDEVLETAYSGRRLTLRDNAAWQILHGVLAYRRDLLVEDQEGRLVSALDHLAAGGQMRGWNVRRGDLLDPQTGRYGLSADVEQGSKSGQGHTDQWLAILSQCDIPSSQELTVDGQRYTLQQLIDQSLYDVPRNLLEEYSWSLIGLTAYVPIDSTWTARDGQTWDFARLVEREANQDLAGSACGGTHRLTGLALSVMRHRRKGLEMTAPWKLAEERVRAAIDQVRQTQNADGSFSSNYFVRSGSTPDLAKHLETTGHIFEFLAMSLSDEELGEPWVGRAASDLCRVLRLTQSVELDCGALYHALHGLAVYRERLFGPRSVGWQNNSVPAK